MWRGGECGTWRNLCVMWNGLGMYIVWWVVAQRSRGQHKAKHKNTRHPTTLHKNTSQHTYLHTFFSPSMGYLAMWLLYVEWCTVALGIISLWALWNYWPWE